MIAEERPPALGWRVSSFGHVLGHAGLSDIDAELEEFSMDPRRSPQRIGDAHLADKLADLRRYSWPATTAPRLPPPVRFQLRDFSSDVLARIGGRICDAAARN